MKPLNSVEKTVIEVQGYRFSALAAGPIDGNLVLFLHGFPEFANAWLDVMRPIAEAGFRAVAVDQRGYSSEARPQEVKDYMIEHLISDVQGFVNALGRRRYHLVGHDWGALLAWELAARHPDRVLSLSALSTPHPDAFFNAIEADEDQKQRSRYIALFRMPGGVAANLFQADDYQRLRGVYQGNSAISKNIRRLAVGMWIASLGSRGSEPRPVAIEGGSLGHCQFGRERKTTTNDTSTVVEQGASRCLAPAFGSYRGKGI